MWCERCGEQVDALVTVNVATPLEDEQDVPPLRCCGWCFVVVVPARNRAEARVVKALAAGARLVWRRVGGGDSIWWAQELAL